MWEDVLWILLYSALGVATFLMARRVKRQRAEWRELKAQLKAEEAEKARLAAADAESAALEERRRLQIAEAQTAVDRHAAERGADGAPPADQPDDAQG